MAPTVTYIEDISNNNNNNESEICDKKNNFPYEIKKLDQKTNEELLKIFKGW